jgi:3'(2'), 5'-bisphosphate nucleotidase
MSALPATIEKSEWADRVRAARDALESAGAGLLSLRGKSHSTTDVGGQLKTSVDRAAEGWVVGYLRAAFPADRFLAEEEFDAGARWTPAESYWTIDALDGTRSFVEGFDGFCLQAAFISGGRVRAACVHEPVARATYLAAEECGAFRIDDSGERRLKISARTAWPNVPVYVDSTRPSGPLGMLLESHGARFLESGSIGLKICRVADGSADLFVKALAWKLWDVAPGQLILEEAGGRLGLWNGAPVNYESGEVRFKNLLAAPDGLFQIVAADLHAAGLGMPR